jgi:hypothetical protein
MEGMGGEERNQVLSDRDRADPGASASVWDAKGLVQVQVGHVTPEATWLG